MTKLQDFLNTPVKETAIFGRRNPGVVGDLFGVELECEGRRVMPEGDDAGRGVLYMWTTHRDGSLRDHHGQSCEWVFNGPVNYDNSIKRIHALFDYFDLKKAKLVPSNRTSTHVHYNMSDKNNYQLVNLFILFTILEEVFDNYCGEDRNGNLFCLSTRHAEAQLDTIMAACFKHYSFAHIGGEMRYCSLNLAALNKFGTVEFRGHRGVDNREDLLGWLSILNEFCSYACYQMKNPVDIIQLISRDTPMGLLRMIFSPRNVERLTKDVPADVLNRSIYDGVRLVQMLCYKIGTEFDQVRLRGRDFWASFSSGQEPLEGKAPEAQRNVFRDAAENLAQAGLARVGRAADERIFRDLINRQRRPG